MNEAEDLKIYKSEDYSIFREDKKTREIKDSRVKGFVDLFKKKDFTSRFPILVNKSLEIMDGHHRFRACQKLNIPVYYVFHAKKSTTMDDRMCFNQVGKKNSLTDTVNILSKDKKNKDVIRLQNMFLEHKISQFQIGTLAKMCYHFGQCDVSSVITDGKFSINFPQKVITVLGFMNKLDKNHDFRHTFKSIFILAVCELQKESGVSTKPFCERLYRNRAKLMERTSLKAYKELLVDVYNHGLRKGRIKLK